MDHKRGYGKCTATRSPPWHASPLTGRKGEAHGSVANSITRLRQKTESGSASVRNVNTRSVPEALYGGPTSPHFANVADRMPTVAVTPCAQLGPRAASRVLVSLATDNWQLHGRCRRFCPEAALRSRDRPRLATTLSGDGERGSELTTFLPGNGVAQPGPTPSGQYLIGGRRARL